ncbi:MAG: hypothetical protein L7H08_07105 [Vulcanisaeta sp.]|nr:hypothetical protein [Vulcanisaeta sp.]
MSHTTLYIDEIKKGNYKIFLEHVFSQLPTPFRWNQADGEILKQHSQELLEIANDLAETYCTVMSNTNIEFFRNQECTEFVKNWWINYVQGPNNDMYWVKLGIMALELFNKNVGVAILTSLPTQLSAMALSMIIKAPQQSGDYWKLSMVLGKLAALTTAFYSEILVHMIVEETGLPLSVFMNLAGHAVEQILKTYRNV